MWTKEQYYGSIMADIFVKINIENQNAVLTTEELRDQYYQ